MAHALVQHLGLEVNDVQGEGSCGIWCLILVLVQLGKLNKKVLLSNPLCTLVGYLLCLLVSNYIRKHREEIYLAMESRRV